MARCGTSLWSDWVSCAPSPPLAHPQPSALWCGVWRGSLAVVQALLSSSQKIGVVSTPFQLRVQNTAAPHGLLREKVDPLQADPVHKQKSLMVIQPKKCQSEGPSRDCFSSISHKMRVDDVNCGFTEPGLESFQVRMFHKPSRLLSPLLHHFARNFFS